MKTCVSMECPFILHCKHYNFLVDRSDGCAHQEQILKLAEKLKKKRQNAKKDKNDKKE